MKKILFLCAVMLVINQSVFSQEEEKKWTIYTSPFLLFGDLFVSDVNDSVFIMDIEGQYKLSESSNVSLTLSFQYNNRTVWDYDYYGYDYPRNEDSDDDLENSSHNEIIYQAGIKPMYIHRPFETGLKGFYLGVYPNIGFQYRTIENKSTFYTELGFGFNIGYKWIFKTGFTMQFGGGVGKTFSIPQKPNGYNFMNSDGRVTMSRSDIGLEFKLGYSF